MMATRNLYAIRMGTPTRIKTANDNLPNPQPLRTKAARTLLAQPDMRADYRSSPNIEGAMPDPVKAQSLKSGTSVTKSLTMTLTLWAAAIVFAIGSFVFGASTAMKAFSSLGLLWAGLWSSYVSADHGRWRLSELSVMSALAGLLGAITTAANYFGLGLTLSDGLILMSILPLFIGLMLKSRICILTSILATLGWGALIFTGGGEISGATALFPMVLAAQLYAATRLNSSLAILLSVGTAYYWGLSLALTWWSADSLPLTFAASALFIVGAANYRCGKAAEDAQLAGSAIHNHFGWALAIIGALGFQFLWLTPDALIGSNATLSAQGLLVWKGVVLVALIAIFGSAIIRYKYSQISFFGIFLLTFACAALPLTLWFPALPQSLVAAIPGMDMMTTIGIMIGASVTAMAIGMMLNGARRQSLSMIVMGACALFAEGYLLSNPELMTIDNIVVFGGTLLTALAIGAVIAGASLAHQAPAPRLKHTELRRIGFNQIRS